MVLVQNGHFFKTPEAIQWFKIRPIPMLFLDHSLIIHDISLSFSTSIIWSFYVILVVKKVICRKHLRLSLVVGTMVFD